MSKFILNVFTFSSLVIALLDTAAPSELYAPLAEGAGKPYVVAIYIQHAYPPFVWLGTIVIGGRHEGVT